jgi:hypothetical protein
MTTRRDAAHADYLAAPLDRRYHGPLRGLFLMLDAESSAKHATVWRVLRGGALVSMRRDEHGKRVLRIARSKKPETGAHEQAWQREVDTFVSAWPEVAAWTRKDSAFAGVAVEFVERPTLFDEAGAQ